MSVTDTGIGIPTAQQQTIFEAFAQGDGTTSRKYGGTGLGLSICRELTRLLAGEITLESQPGVGSTFTLYLPIASPVVAWSGTPADASSNGSAESSTRSPALKFGPTAAHAARKQTVAVIDRPLADGGSVPREMRLAGKKILVVDDDIRNTFALTAVLERQGMEVTSVNSGGEALETLSQTADIDIALVDVMMPEMDGYATMARMRAVDSFRDRPIIALTAKAMKGDREKCIEAGASDYIAKPVVSSHLVAMLRSWLSH